MEEQPSTSWLTMFKGQLAEPWQVQQCPNVDSSDFLTKIIALLLSWSAMCTQGHIIRITILVCCMSTAGARSWAEVRYVDAGASGENSGLTWRDAYVSLQDALLDAANGGGLIDELWVAGGVYAPAEPGGDRNVSFVLVNNLALYGGFAGHETSLDERNIAANVTTLSGDLNGDDGPRFTQRGDNSFYVVRAFAVDNSAVLDGFTLSGGYAENLQGGALHVESLGPVVSHCTFSGNYAGFDGGGIYLISANGVLVRDCTFRDNLAVHNGGGIAAHYSTMTVKRCLFLDNEAQLNNGGGFYHQFATSTLVNCSFLGNRADADVGDGGGLFFLSGSGTLANCLFSGNTAAGAISEGGGAQVYSGTIDIRQSTFVGNYAGRWGGGFYAYQSTSNITNSIFWRNADVDGGDELSQLQSDTPNLTVNYSCVQDWSGALGGDGNIGSDPFLADPDGMDDQFGTSDDDARLTTGSPCIDAGDSTAVPSDSTDLDDDGDVMEPLPLDLDEHVRQTDDPRTPDSGNAGSLGVVVDMGAYEFASTIPKCEGDANGDGAVDPLDSGYVLARFGCSVGGEDPACDASDVNLDGSVDPLDAGFVLARLGVCQ